MISRTRRSHSLHSFFLCITAVCLFSFVFSGISYAAALSGSLDAVTVQNAAFGVTPALSELVAPVAQQRSSVASSFLEIPRGERAALPRTRSASDPIIQGGPVVSNMPDPILSFDGMGNLDGVAPSDCNGDVGPNHYVEMINDHFCIYDKETGSALIEPMLMSTLFAAAGFPAPASTIDNGDPIVLYDPLADRWMISQFIVEVTPCHEVIAVSQTPDPAGAWYLYDFVMPNDLMNDYPKFGVWPDAYYMTDNQFGEASVDGVGVFAFDRVRMLAGDPDASYQYFNLYDVNPDYWAMLPADMDGQAPPDGAPGYFMMLDKGYLNTDAAAYIWEFDVDWDEPTNSTFGINGEPNISLPVADFDASFVGGRSVIPQKGTTTKLDPLNDALMYRLQYRNFTDQETLTVCHTVNVGDNRAGIRYYVFERALPEGSFVIADQATYAPDDGNSRWMGSAALDGQGNLAIGFSISGTNMYPSIRYAGRMHDDATGGLWRGEASLIEGTAAQTGVSRWGDYSMLAVDPTDESTFWYNAQYSKGSWNWQTRIGSFLMNSANLGYVAGSVSNAFTGDPVAGARVGWAGESGFATTAADGTYEISVIAATRPMIASATYFRDSAPVDVEIIAGTTSHVDFAITPIALLVLPDANGTAIGPQGGAYAPQSFSYTVSNASLSAFVWTSVCQTAWLDVAPSSGELSSFASTTIVCSLNQQAEWLSFGSHVGTVQIAIPSDEAMITEQRSIVLSVTGSAPLQKSFSFESGLPAGWFIDGEGWSFSNSCNRDNLTGGTGAFAMVDSDCIGQVELASSLITERFDLSHLTAASLTFKSDFRHYSGDAAHVDYSLNGTNGPWKVLWTAPESGQRGPITVSLDLSGELEGESDVTFRFYYSGHYCWWWQVDDVSLWGAETTSDMVVEPVSIWQTSLFAGETPDSTHHYRITSSGTNELTCAITWPVWLDGLTSVVIPAGESAVVTAAVTAASSQVGVYTASILFSNTVSAEILTRDAALEIIEPLVISPTTPFTVSGLEGGPFTPSNHIYSISNASSASLEWTVNADTNWLDFDLSSGTLAGGSMTTTTAAVWSDSLTNAGTFAATVTFSNETTGVIQTRSVTADVIEITGSIGVFDSIAPTNDLYLPFGVVTGLTPRVEHVIIANTAENARSLVVSNIFFGYFTDMFDGTNAPGWEPVDGNWSVSNSAYHAASDQTEFMCSRLKDAAWSNVWIETEVSLSATNMLPHGLVFHSSADFSTSAGIGYYLLLNQSGGNCYFAVFRQNNTTPAPLQNWTLSSAIKATTNTLSVNIEDSSIRCYINGTLVWDGTDDSPLPAGSIALTAYNTTSAPCSYSYQSVAVGPNRERGIGLGRKQTYYNSLGLDGDIYGPYPDQKRGAVSLVPEESDLLSVEWPVFDLSPTSQPPFVLSNLPALPISLIPGASFTVDVTYAAANLNSNANVITIINNANTNGTIAVRLDARQALGVVSGRVTSAHSGAGLSNAAVRFDFGFTNYTALSGDGGYYRRTLPMGSSTGMVIMTGFATSMVENIVLTNDGEVLTQNFALSGGLLAFSTDSFSNNLYRGVCLTNWLTITNSGALPVTFSMQKSTTNNWLSISTNEMSLEINAVTNLPIILLSGNVPAGQTALQADLSFTGSFVNALAAVPVALTVYSNGLAVTPYSVSMSGVQGGAFSPDCYAFTLTNSLDFELGWSLICTSDWLTISATQGVLAANSASSVTGILTIAANRLPAGSHTAAFIFQSDLAQTIARPAVLTVTAAPTNGGDMVVHSATGFTASGYQFGPFSPTSATWRVTNTGNDAMPWSVSHSETWLTVAPTGGTLEAGAFVTLQASLSADVTALTDGIWTDALVISNGLDGSTVVLPATIDVFHNIGRIAITNDHDALDGLNLPFGATQTTEPGQGVVTVMNTSDVYSLIITNIGFGCFEQVFTAEAPSLWIPKSPTNWLSRTGQYIANNSKPSDFMQSLYDGNRWADGCFRTSLQRGLSDEGAYAFLVARASDDFVLGTNSTGDALCAAVSGNGWFYMAAYKDGQRTLLQSPAFLSQLRQDGASNTIQFQTEGTNLALIVNDVTCWTGSLPDLAGPTTAGRCGLAAFSGTSGYALYTFTAFSACPATTIAPVQRIRAVTSDSSELYPVGYVADDAVPHMEEILTLPVTRNLRTASTGFGGVYSMSLTNTLPLELAAGASADFSVAFSPVGSSEGRARIEIQSQYADITNLTVALSGYGVPDSLVVSPVTGLTAIVVGDAPATLIQMDYSLTSQATSNLDFSITHTQSWVTVSTATGTLQNTTTQLVRVALAANLSSFDVGTYGDTLTFSNTLTGITQTRPISVTVTEPPVPDVPSSLTANGLSATGFTGTWAAVTYALSYRFDLATDVAFTNYVAGYSNLVVQTTSLGVTGLQPGTAYYCRVRAQGRTQSGASSSQVMVRTHTRPSLALNSSSLSITGVYGSASITNMLIISNVGETACAVSNRIYYTSPDQTWLTITPANASLNAGAAVTQSVVAAISGLNVGSYYVIQSLLSTESTNMPLSVSIELIVERADQTIIFPNPGSVQYVSNVVPLIAQGGASTKSVVFSVTDGPGEIVNNSSLIFSGTGSVTVAANQAGDDNFNAASAVEHVISVIASPFSVNSPFATRLSTNSARMGGCLVVAGQTISQRGVVWSVTNGFDPDTGAVTSETGTFTTGRFSVDVSPLPAKTVIYYRVFAVSGSTLLYTDQARLTMQNPSAPFLLLLLGD
ncbi:MAG: hypothetical protein EOL87_11150 [Spartobacteria bacterium]|nr:hypothetical protein [Spartobacteria bacterium]